MPNEQKAHEIANLNVDWQPSQIGRKKKANHWAKSIKTRSKLSRHISFTLWMAFEHGTFILDLHTIQPHLLCQRKHDNEHFSFPFQNVCQFFTHNVESFAAFPLFPNTFTSFHSRSFLAFFTSFNSAVEGVSRCLCCCTHCVWGKTNELKRNGQSS